MPRGAIYTPDPLEKHPLNEGLVAAWLPIPGLTGGRFLYDLARFNHGTLTNGPTWVAGQGELGALQFDGSNDYVDAPAVISAYPFTMSCYMWSDGSGSGTFRTFFSQGVTSGGSGADYLVLQLGSGSFGTTNNAVTYNTAGAIIADTLSVADSRWHLVTGVSASATSHALYIDGQLRASSSASSPTPAHNQTCLGALSYPAGPIQLFPGRIDFAAFHKRALTDREIGGLNDQILRDCPDLLRRVPTSRTVVMGGGASSPITVTPTAATLNTTGYQPTIRLPKVVTPTTRALTITTYAPTVLLPKTATPTTASLTTTGYAPTVATPRVVAPPTKALTTTGYAPTVKTPRVVTPATKALTLTTYAPSVRLGVKTTPGAASLNTTGYAPTVRTPRTATPAARALSLTGYAPNVVVPGQVIPTPAALNLTGYPPTVRTPRVVTTGPGSLTATGYAPTVRLPRVVVPGARSLVLTGFAPTVTVGGSTPTPERVDTGFWGVVDQAASWGVVNDSGGWDVVDETARWKP